MIDAAQRLIDEGYAARRKGDMALALDRYQAAVASLCIVSSPQRLAHCIRHVADMQRETGEFEAAKQNYAEALAIYRGDPSTGKLDLANTLRGFALMMESLEDLPAAQAMWAEAGELYAAAGVQAGIDEAVRRVRSLSD